jgi:hypothetical protein
LDYVLHRCPSPHLPPPSPPSLHAFYPQCVTPRDPPPPQTPLPPTPSSLCNFGTTFGTVGAQQMQIFTIQASQVERANKNKPASERVLTTALWDMMSCWNDEKVVAVCVCVCSCAVTVCVCVCVCHDILNSPFSFPPPPPPPFPTRHFSTTM